MRDADETQPFETITRVVLDLLASEGYDGIKLRDVASRAHVSLSTIYKLFPTREELIVAAVARWADENVYSRLVGPSPESLFEALIWLAQVFFDALERDPWIVRVYQRSRNGRSGSALDIQHRKAFEAVAAPHFENLDPSYAEDLAYILDQVHVGLMTQIADGSRSIRDANSLVQRAVFRLTHDNEGLARGHSTFRRAKGIRRRPDQRTRRNLKRVGGG